MFFGGSENDNIVAMSVQWGLRGEYGRSIIYFSEKVFTFVQLLQECKDFLTLYFFAYKSY